MYQHVCQGAECVHCSPFGLMGEGWAPAISESEPRDHAWWGIDSTGALVRDYPKSLKIGTTILLIVGTMDNRQVLCQQRADNRWWAFPGGAMQILESVQGCALREMKEETGLDVTIQGLVCVDSHPDFAALTTYHDGVVHYLNLTFLAQLSGSYPPGVVPSAQCCQESLALRWVPLHHLPEPFLLNHKWRFEQAMRHRGPFIPVR